MLISANIPVSFMALIASIVNGAIGYGFSSIVTPIAVLFVSNKILNPALVICELGVNIVLLFVERKNIRNTWKRGIPFIVGVLPGVIVGSIALTLIAPTTVKIVLYIILFPLVIAQLLGFSRVIKHEAAVSPFLGVAIGFLYSLTTISGPPLALFWRNQGLSKDEFRCVVSQVRVAEASFTTISYFLLGLFTTSSTASQAVGLIPYIVLPVIVGIPIGVFLLRGVSPEHFKRLVMGADSLLITLGLTNTLSGQMYFSTDTGYVIFLIASIPLIILTIIVLRKTPSEKSDTGTGLFKRHKAKG